MKTTKHFALASLLVVGATLSASTPARAQGGGYAVLDCVVGVGDPDYGASGGVSAGGTILYGGVSNNGTYYVVVNCRVILACSDLTPGATYSFSVGGKTFKAHQDGSAEVTLKNIQLVFYAGPDGYDCYTPLVVSRQNPNGTWTPVLAADIPW
jgi:hypothetical protein